MLSVMRSFRRQSCVGVDMGNGSLKVVHLAKTRRGMQLLYAGLLDYPPESLIRHGPAGVPSSVGLIEAPAETRRTKGESPVAAVAEFIRKRLGAHGRVAASLPGNSPVVRYMTRPKISPKELREALRWEAGKILSKPVQDVVYDYIIVGEKEVMGKPQHEVLLVIAEKASLRDTITRARRLVPKVAAIDLSVLATCHAVEFTHPESDAVLVVVDLGVEKTDVIVGRRGRPRLIRTVLIGCKQMNLGLQERFNLHPQEAEWMKREAGLRNLESETSGVLRETVDHLVTEISRSLDYYQTTFEDRGTPKIILTGGGALLPGLRDYLAGPLGAEVVVDDPFARLDADTPLFLEAKAHGPRFTAAVGLALRWAA